MRTKKKSIWILLLAALWVIGSLLCVFSYAGASAGESAYAATYGWTPSVKHLTDPSKHGLEAYTDINQHISVAAEDTIAFFVRISDANLVNGSTYKYFASPSKLDVTDSNAVNAVTWSKIEFDVAAGTNYFEEEEDGETVSYIYADVDVNESFEGYVYFRREYTVIQSGSGVGMAEYSPVEISLAYTIKTGDAPQIVSVRATVPGGTAYNGTFVSTAITFTVTTKLMEDRNGVFDPNAERLSYSVDDGVNYIPIAKTNVVDIKDRPLEDKAVIFRVTDMAGKQEAFYTYGDNEAEGEHRINMDPYMPEFTVSAEITSENGTEEYRSGAWTSEVVTFVLQNTSKCCSEISFYYAYTSGGADIAFSYASSGKGSAATARIPIYATSSGIRFRAVNAAGTVYDLSGTPYAVNRDDSVPHVSITVLTPSPDNPSGKNELARTRTGNAIDFGYANGSAEVYVFNRYESGIAVDMPSGAKYEYQEKLLDAEGNYSYQGEHGWKTLNTQVMSDLGDSGFMLSYSTAKAILLEKTVKFRITSGAGKVSEEQEITFKIVKSAFTIDLGGITAEVNDKGWIADRAVVRVSVPVDSVRTSNAGEDSVYSEPTVMYSFYYKPSNSLDDPIQAQFVRRGTFHKEAQDEVRFWFEFDIDDASADSTFTIYAKNAAGKASANTITTDEKIRIDVQTPMYDASAYIHPTVSIPMEDRLYIFTTDTDSAEANAQWVNGQIVLTLRVRDSVSGVYVKEMIYATENGRILRDENTKEIIWQERNQQYTPTETQIRADEHGVDRTWYVYRITIDATGEMEEGASYYIGSKEYKYRISTNSGKYVDFGFTANIDTSTEMYMSYVTATSGDKSVTVENLGGSGQRYIDLEDSDFSVWEQSTLTFGTSLDRAEIADHYLFRYALFDGSELGADEMIPYAESLDESLFTTLRCGSNISFDIPTNAIGDYYAAVYFESTSRKYEGSVIGAGPYVIRLHYDTKNLVITYALQMTDDNQATSDNLDRGNWVTGELEVTVTVVTDDIGGVKMDDGYSFYYMKLTTVTGGIPDTGWIRIEDGRLTENDNAYNYEFKLSFDKESFSGYIAVSVCNKAGFRSKQNATGAKLIKIDNTTPEVDQAIDNDKLNNEGYVEGERKDDSYGQITVAGIPLSVYTYYSTEEIRLRVPGDDNRSAITYYYKILPQPSEITTHTYSDSEFTKLSGSGQQINLFERAGETLGETYKEIFFALFAENEVKTLSTDATRSGESFQLSCVYRFIYDPSELTGSMAYDPSNGYNNESNGMFGYLWKEEAKLYATATGNKAPGKQENYILYQFSVDDGETWFDYLDYGAKRWYASNVEKPLVFSPSLLREYTLKDGTIPFDNGVDSVFTFRARNKAGATVTYKNVYIAMEDTVPEFEITLTDNNNATYYGGVTDLASDPEKWSSSPITVKIDVTRMPASGVQFRYYIEYLDGSMPVSTAADGSFGKTLANYKRFSTDTLDGFEYNRDAILTITAFSNSSESRRSEVKVRIAVDQVVPEFALTGRAARAGSSLFNTISSGQWTNMDTVSVSRSVVNRNVSPVVYRYAIKKKDSTEAQTEFTVWSDSVGSLERSESCVITVTATSAANLVYERDFEINIDTIAPIIRFDGGINVIEGEEYYIDLRVYVEEANIDICEYITIIGDTRGFAFNPGGTILSTSSVDNSTHYTVDGTEYRGYVKVYVKDHAGNEASIWFYVLPFRLTVNNLTLTDEDLAQVDAYEAMLTKARVYMEPNRVAYFENLISRLNDRENTLRKEIKGYQDYLEKLYNRVSFELRSDYAEMFSYMETFNNYKEYGQAWIQEAITGDASSKYYFYYQNFLTQFKKLQALMAAVETTEADVTALPAINRVERKNYEDILRVYDEYRNLTQDQRACFTANLFNKLTDLKKACEVLLLTDEKLGVSIDGDFAPGATISVTEFTNSTETYINAQNTLAKTVSANQPRTIVSVYRVQLDGAYAQTAASNIEVTLPITAEYQNYIYFSVYTLSDDGTMALVKDTEIQADGKSVAFSTDKLQTYVLCVRAQMEQTETSEGEYGTILGLKLTTKMIRYLIYIGAALVGLILLIVVITGLRHRRFLNSYNRAYRHSLYRRGVKGIPKGNKK